MIKLDQEFYVRDPVTVAKELLGKLLVHNINGLCLSGRIVETEAYCGHFDKACHSYGMKKTKRNEVMYQAGGIAYVYLIYGMYHCLNAITEDAEHPSAVLIRAIEPNKGIDHMARLRFGSPYTDLNQKQRYDIARGPGKLCIAMGINKKHNGVDLCGETLYICESDNAEISIIAAPRINIGYAEEYSSMPWRFFIEANRYVSSHK